MIKTDLGNQVRECLAGQSPGNFPSRPNRWGKVSQKVRQWQKLARKYAADGLSNQEVETLLDELQDKKTADLILELTVRSSDLKDAGSEVRIFLDRLMEDLAVKYPPALPGEKRGTKSKKLTAATPAKITGKLPQTRNWEHQVQEVLGLIAKLEGLRGEVSTAKQATWQAQPERLLGELKKYLQGEIKRYQHRRQSPFQSLKIRIFGTDN